MTIETKYNVGDSVRYRESEDNTLLESVQDGRVATVGVFYDGKTTYISYTVNNPTIIRTIFEQQIVGRV